MHVSSLAANNIELIPLHVFQFLVEMLLNGHVFLVQMLLKHISISSSGRVYSETGPSANLLVAATIGQQLDIIKLLLNNFSVNPYSFGVDENPFVFSTFSIAPQSFTIDVLKCCGVKPDFKAKGVTLLHAAVFANCYDVVQFLLKECKDLNINITDDHDLYTPLHLAYLCGHPQIAEYLIRHDADVYAVDNAGNMPYDYIDGELEFISYSQYLQNKRKIHHTPYSTEHRYFMKLVNNNISNKDATALTMEQFPTLKEDGPTQPYHDMPNAAAIKEFTQYVTKGLADDKPWRRPLSQELRQHVMLSS